MLGGGRRCPPPPTPSCGAAVRRGRTGCARPPRARFPRRHTWPSSRCSRAAAAQASSWRTRGMSSRGSRTRGRRLSLSAAHTDARLGTSRERGVCAPTHIGHTPLCVFHSGSCLHCGVKRLFYSARPRLFARAHTPEETRSTDVSGQRVACPQARPGLVRGWAALALLLQGCPREVRSLLAGEYYVASTCFNIYVHPG